MTAVFETLLLKLVTVLELTQQSETTALPQMKQNLLQSTNDFKDSLKQAKEVANNLPGGELSVQEQDEIIEMLEKLKERKRQQLEAFAGRASSMAGASNTFKSDKMEVDSTASTPS
ncbi:hypothetical protein BKA93DRAFT_541185 [Sparassis latifolia]